MRKILQIENRDEGITVKVFYDYISKEYICRLYKNSELQWKADYFTDDKQDAIDTARLIFHKHI